MSGGIVLDSSAIVAVLLREPDAERCLERIESAEMVVTGAPTVVETAMVLSRYLGRDSRPALAEFLREAEVEVVDFREEHARVAMRAFDRFGKGRHGAALNYGDCLAYAVARVSGLPLLHSGNDFRKCDIALA
jgi:ribonuclease VapC